MTFNKIYVELTNICGLSCSFCPSQKPPTNTMNVDDFESIIKQVSNYTNVITFHMFGDPLTLSNLEQYLDITHKYNLKVEIVTSGYYLNKFNPKIFLHTAIRQINFSLNSFNKNDMGMSLDEYLQYMFDICKLKLQSKANFFINFRLWNLSKEKKSYSFNIEVIKKLEEYFNISINKEEKDSIRLDNKILLDFDNYFQWPSLESTNNTNGTCYGLKSHIGILSNGDVVPCCLDCNGHIVLGNLQNNTLDYILNDKKAQNIIEGFKNNIAVEVLCKKCTFKHRFN
jgi:radical SAM protein with 4Fe4S-binding SPASM domain